MPHQAPPTAEIDALQPTRGRAAANGRLIASASAHGANVMSTA
jgi:hypothetical protein